MKHLTTFLLFILTLNVTAQNRKLSTWVRQAVKAQQAQQKTPEELHRVSAASRYLTAFVETDNAALLADYGCKTYARLGDISIATIPLSQVEALAQHPAISRIEASQSAHTLMDTVPQVIDVLPVWESTQAHAAFTGHGVVVGLMDVGFDLTHPNFYDTTMQRCRIGAFWDQLSPDTIGSPFPVGRDFVGTDAVLTQRCSTDSPTENHGTHTLGIAAGSGYDTPYRGVTYDCDICLVANAVTSDTIYIDSKDYYKYTSATDALGFKYLFDYADQQGKPCVVSFSEGYSPYLDDEDRLFNEFLEQLTGPGHIIVASAGNESLNTTYAGKPAGVSEAGAFINVSKQAACYRLKADGAMNIVLYAYGDGSTITQTLRIASDDERLEEAFVDTLFINEDTCAIAVSRYASEFEEGITMYTLDMSANKDLNQLPYIALVVEGQDSHVEIYGNSSAKLTTRDTDLRWNAAAKGHNILAPGCFPSVICVGATTHRIYYKDLQGKYHENRYGGQQGVLGTYSSIGPAINGLNKPDVTAPGTNVYSSHNSFFAEHHPGVKWNWVDCSDFNGRQYPWRVDSGTSMSTPAVAATIALWLEANPQLTRDDIMGVLSRTSQHLEPDLTYPNNLYGYGEIDAYRGLLDVLGITGIKEISQTPTRGVSVWAKRGQLHLQFDQLPTQPFGITIYTTNGVVIYQTTLNITQRHSTIPLPVMSRGIYVVQTANGSAIIRI